MQHPQPENEPPIYSRAEIEQLALEAARRNPGKSFEVVLVLGIASAPAPTPSILWMDGEHPDTTDEQPPEEPPARPCDVWLKKLPRWIQERAERAMAKPKGVYLNNLSGAFTWSSTPEGGMFWDCVDEHLKRGTPLPIAPPDDPEHNPDNLKPEQVGVVGGWRLLRRSEVDPDRTDSVAVEGWLNEWRRDRDWCACDEEMTYRTRLPYGELDKAPTQ